MDSKTQAKVKILLAHNQSSRDREEAASWLGDRGRKAIEAIPSILSVLSDPDDSIRRAGLSCLRAVLGDAEKKAEPYVGEILKTLKAKLEDPQSETVIWELARALGALGTPALDTILEAFQSEVPHVRKAACLALGGYPEEPQSSDAGRALPSLISSLKDEKVEVRRAACLAFRNWKERAAPAVRALIEALSDKDERVVEYAVDSLEVIGPAAREAVPALIPLLKDEKHRRNCINALEYIGDPSAKEAVGAYAKDPDGDTAMAARRALVIFLGKSTSAVSDADIEILIDAARDPSNQGGDPEPARKQLQDIGERAIARILLRMKAKDFYRRYGGLTVLGGMGDLVLPHLPEIVAALEDPKQALREAAAGALRRLGSKGTQALLQALQSKDANSRQGAAKAFGALELSEAEAAIPLLTKALSDADTEVQAAARESLAVLAPEKLPNAQKLDRKLLKRMNEALAACRKEGHQLTLSPLIYLGDETPPVELLQLWMYAIEVGEVPCGLELRNQLKAPETDWFEKGSEKPKSLRGFAEDGDGGAFALWLCEGRTLKNAPVVFLGSEGETVVMADSFRDFLIVLASGQKGLGYWVADGMKAGGDKDEAKPRKLYRQWLKAELGLEPSPKVAGLIGAQGVPDFSQWTR